MCGGDGWRHCSCVLTPVYFSEQVRIWHGHLIRCTVAVRWRRPGGRCSSLGTADSGLPKHTLEDPDLASEPAPPPPPPALLMPRPWQKPWSKGGQCQCSHTALASWHSSVPLRLQTQVPVRPAGALGIIHKFLRGLFRLIVYKNQKWESAPTRILTINSHHTDFLQSLPGSLLLSLPALPKLSRLLSSGSSAFRDGESLGRNAGSPTCPGVTPGLMMSRLCMVLQAPRNGSTTALIGNIEALYKLCSSSIILHRFKVLMLQSIKSSLRAADV